jgi:hypothetical protein
MNKILKQQIETAKGRFGNKFDYSRYEYLGSKVKSIVTCPLHGEVECLIYAHAKSVYGCTKCGTLVNRSLFSADYFKKHIPDIVEQYYDLSSFDVNDPAKPSVFIYKKDNTEIICSAVDFVTRVYHSHSGGLQENSPDTASLPIVEDALLNVDDSSSDTDVALDPAQELASNTLPDNAITFSINGLSWSLSFDPVIRFIKFIGKKIKI